MPPCAARARRLGQAVVVEDKPGASGVVAALEIARFKSIMTARRIRWSDADAPRALVYPASRNSSALPLRRPA